MNSIVANAIAARAVAKNAAEKIEERFSPSIRGQIRKGDDYTSWSVEIFTDGLTSAYSSKSAQECIAQCEAVIKHLDEKKNGLVKAIAWLKKNA